jgi:hypothetical protein
MICISIDNTNHACIANLTAHLFTWRYRICLHDKIQQHHKEDDMENLL